MCTNLVYLEDYTEMRGQHIWNIKKISLIVKLIVYWITLINQTFQNTISTEKAVFLEKNTF
jgi:hypothetical protein